MHFWMLFYVVCKTHGQFEGSQVSLLKGFDGCMLTADGCMMTADGYVMTADDFAGLAPFTFIVGTARWMASCWPFCASSAWMKVAQTAVAGRSCISI